MGKCVCMFMEGKVAESGGFYFHRSFCLQYNELHGYSQRVTVIRL